MEKQVKAKNNFILTKKHEPESQRAGLVIPDVAKKKPQTADIISVGKMTEDRTIREGQVAYFHQTAGFPLDIEGEEYWVLRSQDVIACTDGDKK